MESHDKTIIIPKEVNTKNSTSFSWEIKKLLDNLTEGSYVLDFSKVTRSYPYGALLLAKSLRAMLREMRNRHVGVEILGNDTEIASYLRYVGFFKYIGIDQGNAPGEAPGSPSYIPITVHTSNELEENAKKNKEQVPDIIEKEAERVAAIIQKAYENLSEEKRNFAFESIAYSLREIMRNSIEHSGDDEVVIFAQSFPNLRQVEIAIMDDGVGIASTLAEKYGNISPMDAITLALSPGVSRSDTSTDTGDKWQNSGFGLYVVSELCKTLPNSQFFMTSSNASYSASCNRNGESLINQRDRYIWDKGTTTMIKLCIDEDFYFPNLLNRIVEKGERIAGTHILNGKASKGSKSVPKKIF